MVLGRDPLDDCWVEVITYGYTDRAACAADITDNDDYLCAGEAGDIPAYIGGRGLCIGYARPEGQYPRSLLGGAIVTFDGNAGSVLLDLTGVDSVVGGNSITWVTKPGKVNDSTVPANIAAVPGARIPRATDSIVGSQLIGSKYVPPETPQVTGGNGIPMCCQAFVRCMGFSPGQT